MWLLWRGTQTGKGFKPSNPDDWSARISAPLLPKIVEIGHEQVFAALATAMPVT